MNKKNLVSLWASIALAGLCCFLFLSIATPAAAIVCRNNNACTATPATPICSNNVCVSGGQWFRDVINRALNYVVWPLFIAFSIAAFMYAGFMYLSAHGDPGHISAAHKAVLWGVIGIAIAILGFSAVGTLRVIIGF